MKSGRLQIVNTLRQMLAGKAIHAFQFHNDLAFDYDVSEVLADAFSLVGDRKADLGLRICLEITFPWRNVLAYTGCSG
jgi:hypothetical protein